MFRFFFCNDASAEAGGAAAPGYVSGYDAETGLHVVHFSGSKYVLSAAMPRLECDALFGKQNYMKLSGYRYNGYYWDVGYDNPDSTRYGFVWSVNEDDANNRWFCFHSRADGWILKKGALCEPSAVLDVDDETWLGDAYYKLSAGPGYNHTSVTGAPKGTLLNDGGGTITLEWKWPRYEKEEESGLCGVYKSKDLGGHTEEELYVGCPVFEAVYGTGENQKTEIWVQAGKDLFYTAAKAKIQFYEQEGSAGFVWGPYKGGSWYETDEMPTFESVKAKTPMTLTQMTVDEEGNPIEKPEGVTIVATPTGERTVSPIRGTVFQAEVSVWRQY